MAKRRPAALSIRPEEYEAAKARADGLGLNFSAYVNSLIRADMRTRQPLTLQETTAPSELPLIPPRQEVIYQKPPVTISITPPAAKKTARKRSD